MKHKKGSTSDRWPFGHPPMCFFIPLPADAATSMMLSVCYTTSSIQIYTPPTAVLTAKVEQVVSEVVTADMSDCDIAKALHDYVVLHCDYDQRHYAPT